MSKKVVHVLGAMNAGGVEAWLMTLLRNTDKWVELIFIKQKINKVNKDRYDIHINVSELYKLY